MQMDSIFVERLLKFYRKNDQKTLHPTSEVKNMLSPYRTPTQKIENNIFIATLIGIKRNKSRC